ncbi:hypothetical protein LDC_1034 [sediment metagenome]|uniref:Uncharacterized protein n=1 Tax=sediment metagenome TaxID=749907 RepID=D9PHN2_9ZZZZ
MLFETLVAMFLDFTNTTVAGFPACRAVKRRLQLRHFRIRLSPMVAVFRKPLGRVSVLPQYGHFTGLPRAMFSTSFLIPGHETI